MPKSHPTNIFVSSTCYDLSQVRSNIADFAKSLGLEPILSELGTFPVDPSADTVSNCLEVVKTRADVFLLIVGGRYGSITDNGKSVTNLEFIEATARSIPRYVFVKRDILALLSTWRANPTADFSASVDSNKLFEFVATLRDAGDLWVFPFDSAQDIENIMRAQLSYLLADCLAIRSRFNVEDEVALKLTPRALRIYVERPIGWEYKLFARALQECFEKLRAKRLDYELGLCYAHAIKIDGGQEAMNWIISQTDQLALLVRNLDKAINSGLPIAVGRPGEAGDAFRLQHLANRVADSYAGLLDWGLAFDQIKLKNEERSGDIYEVIGLARALANPIIKNLQDFADCLYTDVCKALETPDVPQNFTLTLSMSDTTALIQGMRRLYAQ